MDRFRKFVERVGSTGPRVQSRLIFPVEKSDVMLFSRVTDLLVRFEPSEHIIAPGSCQLAGEPGVRRLTDGDRSVTRLIWRNDHCLRYISGRRASRACAPVVL